MHNEVKGVLDEAVVVCTSIAQAPIWGDPRKERIPPPPQNGRFTALDSNLITPEYK
jgi:hypothetical protein